MRSLAESTSLKTPDETSARLAHLAAVCKAPDNRRCNTSHNVTTVAPYLSLSWQHKWLPVTSCAAQRHQPWLWYGPMHPKITRSAASNLVCARWKQNLPLTKPFGNKFRSQRKALVEKISVTLCPKNSIGCSSLVLHAMPEAVKLLLRHLMSVI